MTSELIGHKTTRMTERYAYRALDNLRTAMKQLNENANGNPKPKPALQVVK
jgi:hypothetical protein